MTESLDAKDIEILKILRTDSRTPMGAIGETLGMSKATVSRRISKMEEKGVISGYSLSLNCTSLGLMKSMVALQVIGNPVSVVIELLSGIKEIRNIFKSFGDHHLVCEVYTNSVDDLYELIQTRLLKMPSIRNVEVDILVEKTPRNVYAYIDMYAERSNVS